MLNDDFLIIKISLTWLQTAQKLSDRHLFF
jgi:hypothetical protein